MTLRHLKIFVEVCRQNSITAASEKLFLAQPSVSLAVKEIEEYYGVKLFDRISNRLYITEAGKRFLEYASHIVSLFAELENGVRDFEKLGKLRIGCSITIGNFLLPPVLQQFQALFPGVAVECLIENTEAVEQTLLQNELDAAFIEGSVHSPYLVQRAFPGDRLIVVAPYGHPLASAGPVSPAKVAAEPLLLRERGSAGREVFESAMLLHGLEVSPLWQSASTQAIVKAVAAGLGLSVLPAYFVRAEIAAKRLAEVTVAGLSMERSFSVVYHKNKYLSGAAEAFISLMEKSSPEQKNAEAFTLKG